jgi:hypothetical protein
LARFVARVEGVFLADTANPIGAGIWLYLYSRYICSCKPPNAATASKPLVSGNTRA